MDRDQALIEEVVSRLVDVGLYRPVEQTVLIKRAIVEALELERSGWQPPVHPDVLAVREICAAYVEALNNHDMAQDYLDGCRDDTDTFQAALAAFRKHKGDANG